MFQITSDRDLARIWGGLVFFLVWIPGAFIANLVLSQITKARERSDAGQPLRNQEPYIQTRHGILEKAKRETERTRQAAEQAERRRRLDYWLSLRGIQFERELATLYRHLGYQVRSTPTSGDQGIDLILTKGGQTTIVQCKGQKRPASPPVVRELYGAFAAFRGAHHAILACNGGFTQGVKEFAIGKPITLISAKELAQMASNIQQIHHPD